MLHDTDSKKFPSVQFCNVVTMGSYSIVMSKPFNSTTFPTHISTTWLFVPLRYTLAGFGTKKTVVPVCALAGLNAKKKLLKTISINMKNV